MEILILGGLLLWGVLLLRPRITGRSMFMASIGTDFNGTWYGKELQSHRVDTSMVTTIGNRNDAFKMISKTPPHTMID